MNKKNTADTFLMVGWAIFTATTLFCLIGGLPKNLIPVMAFFAFISSGTGFGMRTLYKY